MSPSEAQLRAALHDGEGDRPDADQLISRALRIRRDRRKRYQTIAGALAAAAVVGVGTTVLVTLGGNGGRDVAGGSAADKRAAAAHAYVASAASDVPSAQARPTASPSAVPVPGLQPAVAAGPPVAAAALVCPSAPAALPVPGGGGAAKFRSTRSLFTGEVASMKLCAYPLRSGAGVRSMVISDPDANKLAKTLDAAPATHASRTCPANTDYVGGTIEILAVNGRGTALQPVVITLGCVTSQATNGTAVRYVRDLPASVVSLVAAVSTKSITGPGTVHGSPPR